jgi:hypothetical protein
VNYILVIIHTVDYACGGGNLRISLLWLEGELGGRLKLPDFYHLRLLAVFTDLIYH